MRCSCSHFLTMVEVLGRRTSAAYGSECRSYGRTYVRRGVLCGLVAAWTMTFAVGVGGAVVAAQDQPTQVPNTGCLATATELSSDQLEKLRRGESVALSRDRFDYLVDAAWEFAPSTWEDLANDTASYMDGSGPEAEGVRLRANVLLLISNPQVRVNDEKADASDSEGLQDCVDRQGASEGTAETGGLAVLPEGLRTGLTEAPMDWDSLGPWERKKPELLTESELAAAASVLGSARSGMSQGSDLNRVLLGRAAEIADVAVDHGLGTFRSEGEFFDFSRERVGDLLSSMIDTAGRDRIALKDLVTGTNEHAVKKGGEVVPGGSFGQFTRDGDSELRSAVYRSSTAIPALLAFDWDEAAGQDEPMVRTLREIGDSGVTLQQQAGKVSGDNDDEQVRELGDETGKALARIVRDRSEMLTRLSGYSDRPLGMVNPQVTDALAAATMPYALEITDRYEDTTSRGQLGVKRLTSVLSTADKALETLVSTMLDMVSRIQQSYEKSPEYITHPRGDRDPRYTLVIDHIRLETGVRQGIGEGLSLVSESGGAGHSEALASKAIDYSSEKSAIPETDTWKRPPISFDEPAAIIWSAPAPYPYHPRPGKLNRAGVELFTENPTSAWTLVNLVYGAPKSRESIEELVAEHRLDDRGELGPIDSNSISFRMSASDALGEVDDGYLDDYELFEMDY